MDGSRSQDEVSDQIRATLAALKLEEQGLIVRKTPEEIEAMAAAGDIVARCLAMLRGMCRPGVTTAELDRAGEKFIRAQGGEPAFKGYRGFPASICTSPNSMVVHGIPGDYELERPAICSRSTWASSTRAGSRTRRSRSRCARSARWPAVC